jgi:hypothetical protein
MEKFCMMAILRILKTVSRGEIFHLKPIINLVKINKYAKDLFW